METEHEVLPRGVVGDRRREPRTRVDVRCQAVTDFDFVLLGEQIVDLSPGGLLLRAEGVPAELGELVILSFQPPGSAQWLDIEARVVRLINGTQPGAPGFGLELAEDLPPFERGLLEAALERAKRRRRRRVRAPRSRRPTRPDAVEPRSVVRVGSPGPTPSGIARRVFIVT